MNFNLDRPIEDFTPEEAENERRRLSFLVDQQRFGLSEGTLRTLAIREHLLGKRADQASYMRRSAPLSEENITYPEPVSMDGDEQHTPDPPPPEPPKPIEGG